MKRLSTLSLLMLSLSCIEELPLPNVKSAPLLVVDGLITQEAGPHTVQLFMTDSLLSGEYFPVTNAKLAITNNLFKTDSLENQGNGHYTTKAGFTALMGKFYKLHIKLKDGRRYESEEQLLYPAGVIDNLKINYKADYYNKNPLTVPKDAFHISVDAHGQPEQSNKFRWRWRGIYEVFTNPELHTTIMFGAEVPDPLPCSGVLTGHPCFCCNCWVTEKNLEAHVSKNNLSRNVFLDESITHIPVDAYRFFIKYYIEVEQLSLSDEAYEFWKRVEAQQAGTSNIFQPNAIRIQGNIHALTDPKEEVLGVFAVSAITRSTRFLTRSDIKGDMPIPAIIPNDCRIVFRNSSNIKPEFW
jgi:hypothetical protein